MIIKSKATLDRYRQAGNCELCGYRLGRREPHHVLKRGQGGGSRLDIPANLLGLCPFFQGNDCHRLRGDDPAYLPTFLSLIAARENFKDGQAVLDYLHLILRTPKGSEIPRKEAP